MIDLYLLSLCDEIVTTSHSTFSYVAHALSAKVPWVVNNEGVCARDITTQPCAHMWDKMENCLDASHPGSVETRGCGNGGWQR